MAIELHSVRAADAVASAGVMMREHQIHRVPVINADAHVVGMLSLNDLAREAVRERDDGENDVPLGGVVSTLAAIGRPRTEANRRGSDDVTASPENRPTAARARSSPPAGGQRASQPTTGKKRHGSAT